MKPMDDYALWASKLRDNQAADVLAPEERAGWDAMPLAEKEEHLRNLLHHPIDDFNVYSWYFRNKWCDALRKVSDGPALSLLEVGSGDTDMLPVTMSLHYPDRRTHYTTLNMNKRLTASLLGKTQRLPIRIDVIEDDAKNMEAHLGPGLLDAVVFEHSVNDVLQAMLGGREGIDTIDSDWFEVLPAMIGIIGREYRAGTLEASVKPGFMELLASCFALLKPGGMVIINHFQYQYDLNLGYDADLWENMLPIAREWIVAAGYDEIRYDDFEPQWWMFLRKPLA